MSTAWSVEVPRATSPKEAAILFINSSGFFTEPYWRCAINGLLENRKSCQPNVNLFFGLKKHRFNQLGTCSPRPLRLAFAQAKPIRYRHPPNSNLHPNQTACPRCAGLNVVGLIADTPSGRAFNLYYPKAKSAGDGLLPIRKTPAEKTVLPGSSDSIPDAAADCESRTASATTHHAP